MPRIPLYELNRDAVLELMEARGFRLTDLQRGTVKVDEPDKDGKTKGVSIALLSELLSEKGDPTRTHTSLRTVRLIALALDVRRPMALVRSSDEQVPA